MTILKSDASSIFEVSCVLKAGGIAVLPTDTVYGFSGKVPDARVRLAALKKRDVSKHFIRLIAEPADIFAYTDQKLPYGLLELWPCALTVIVRLKHSAGTCAFRCPDDKWLRTIIDKTGSPVYSTSVNYAGGAVFSDIEEIRLEFEKKVDLIVDAGVLRGLSSTVLDMSLKKPSVLRQGTVNVEHFLNG